MLDLNQDKISSNLKIQIDDKYIMGERSGKVRINSKIYRFYIKEDTVYGHQDLVPFHKEILSMSQIK